MRVLITGANGFVGRYLAHFMKQTGHEVIGTVWGHEGEPPEGIKTVSVNLLDFDAMAKTVQEVRPEWIVHLASVSFLPESFVHVLDAWRINLFGTLHLLEAARLFGTRTRILYVSSAAVYGLVNEDQIPLTETMPLRPAEPYGASKAAGELAAMQYMQSFGLPVICARTFNYTGPGQPSMFVCSEFAWMIAMAEAGKMPPVLNVGNLKSRRDITDVRDLVVAYAGLVEKGVPGEVYNVASGRDIPVSQVLDILLGMTSIKVQVKVDKGKIRPVEFPVVVGDSAKIAEAIGWRPQISLEQTLADTLNWWRVKVAENKG